MTDTSSGFVLCIMSLQMLWSEWLQLLKYIPCYNPKYVRYRNLPILIFFWANSYFTNCIFFDLLWSLPLAFTIYLVSLLKLWCSLWVVNIQCLGIAKVRKKTSSLSLFPSHFTKPRVFLRNIYRHKFQSFSLFIVSLNTDKGSKIQTE